MWFNLVLFVSVAIFVRSEDQQNDFYQLDTIYNEAPCLQAGGICVIAADCPEGRLARSTGLCPSQQERGVECCHGLSRKETRCSKSGGDCMPKTDQCAENLLFSRATDCMVDEKCCILV